jgi:hypothetical protein
LNPLDISDPLNSIYTYRFIVPETFTGTQIKVSFYASKSTVLTTSDSITIDAFCATYGDWITRGTLDAK